MRLVQGRAADATEYSSNPVEVALQFERDGAEMLHVVDLDAAFALADSPNRRVLENIASSVSISVQTGGGIRSLKDAEGVFEIGVTRIVVGTLAVEQPRELARIVKRFGANVVVGIDARNGEVMTRGWEQAGKISALELARRIADLGVERVVYTDIKRDGMLVGINLEETLALALESGLRVTASGGVASLDDIAALYGAFNQASNLDSVIVGKALYENRFTLREALQIARGEQVASA